MNVLLAGAGLFATSFLVHLVYWRISIPRRQTSALLVLFFATALVAFVLDAILFGGAVLDLHGFWQVLHAGLLYTSLTLVYVILYSALENESPTLAIVEHVAASGDEGCTAAEVRRAVGRSNPVARRINLLASGSLVVRADDRYALTRKGRWLARLFSFAASGIGLQPGG